VTTSTAVAADEPERPNRTARLHLPAVGSLDYPNTLIEYAGHDLTKGVRSLRLTAGVGRFTELDLELAVFETTTFSGEVRLHISDPARDVLIALGWTPPGAQPAPTPEATA